MLAWLSPAAYIVFALAPAEPAAVDVTTAAPAPVSEGTNSSTRVDTGPAAAEASVPGDAPRQSDAVPPGEPSEELAEPLAADETEPAQLERRFMIGIEAVGMQIPPLRPTVVTIDPRTARDTATLGGVGGFFRFRPTDIVGLDLTVRSGSLRYVDVRTDEQNVISQDLIGADVGTIVYLARGEMGSVGIDAGVGAMFHRIGYALGDSDASSQRYTSIVSRIGFDVELVTRRVAFVFTLRSLGVITPQGAGRTEGPAFANATDEQKKPTASTFQTYVVGGAGVAYRF